MLITMENAVEYRLHGITILDEHGEPMQFVQEFATETMQARIGRLGTELETVTASDYVIFFNDELHRQWLEANLPDAAMLDHLQPVPRDEALPPLPDECIDNSPETE